jgi:hypothetical protein
MPLQLPPPPDDTEAAILRLVVAQYPNGGPHHEPAIRMALRLGWTAGLATTSKIKDLING